jgi:2-C-methyl-D-erythritol 4-phosphate cytidylyltransferase
VNYAVILAAGVGQRMRSAGLPKQFLNLMGKPIVAYTLEKFEECEEIDRIIIVSHGNYVDRMQRIIELYEFEKVEKIVVGGADRQNSLKRGLDAVQESGAADDDIVVIHDGVRPLVDISTIRENIRVAKQYGCAITAHPVTESVVITAGEDAGIDDFKKRADTYTLTAPQTFLFKKIMDAYEKTADGKQSLPLLDAAMVYASFGERVHLVKEQGSNLKITTPEDYYVLKAILEMEENKYVFGL